MKRRDFLKRLALTVTGLWVARDVAELLVSPEPDPETDFQWVGREPDDWGYRTGPDGYDAYIVEYRNLLWEHPRGVLGKLYEFRG